MTIATFLAGLVAGTVVNAAIYICLVSTVTGVANKDRQRNTAQLDELNKLRADSNCHQERIADALEAIVKKFQGDKQ